MSEISSYLADPDSFLALFEKTQNVHHISKDQFELNSSYRFHEHGEGFGDASFILHDAGRPVALVLAHLYSDVLKFNDVGIQIYVLDSELFDPKEIIESCLQQAGKIKAKSIVLQDDIIGDHLSDFSAHLYHLKASHILRFFGHIDLHQSQAEIKSQMRKSYKSLINKGLRDLDIRYMTKENADENLFHQFREFHKTVAGRVTRPLTSWNIQFQMIQKGMAELICATRPGEDTLLSASLFTDFGTQTTYAVGVYDRNQFSEALAHPLVYEGIGRAKERAQQIFNLGEFISYSSDREKEYNISKFKKGFTHHIKPLLDWQLPVD